MAAGAPQLGHVALLRGVNVGGRNLVRMEALRQIATDLGLIGARTYLQSGNLVFLAPDGEGRQAGETLQRALSDSLGVSVRVIVRTQAGLAAAISANPFGQIALNDPARLLVVFMSGAPILEGLPAVRAAARLGERIDAVANEVFIHYAGGAGASRVTAALIDRSLGAVGTARNWNTVLALEALARRMAEDA
jgi:uncharacterized protein (DUF1697 family)